MDKFTDDLTKTVILFPNECAMEFAAYLGIFGTAKTVLDGVETNVTKEVIEEISPYIIQRVPLIIEGEIVKRLSKTA